jgi:hypothetical protein
MPARRVGERAPGAARDSAFLAIGSGTLGGHHPRQEHSMPAPLVLCLVLLATVLGVAPATAADAPAAAGTERCFEMRTYTANPGKLTALHARFRDHTNALFVKHGMTLIGYWTPTDGDAATNTLVYILAYPSRAAREESWKAFQADPEWQKAKAASEVDGVLVGNVVSVFLKPTDYSPIK